MRYKTILIRIINCVVVYYYLNIISRVLKDRLTAFFISFIDCFILTVRAYIFLRVILCDLFNIRKVLLCSIEVIDSYLIHRYIHDWRVRPLIATMMSWKIGVANRGTSIILTDIVCDKSTTILFLNFLHWLENGR